jgi:hypothetical protein
MEIHVRGEYEFHDFRKALRLHAQSSRLRRIYIVVLSVLAPVLGFVVVLSRPQLFGQLFPALIVCLLFLFINLVSPWLGARQLWRGNPNLRGSIEFVFSEEMAKYWNASGRTETNWTSFAKWREDKSLFLLYINQSMFWCIPKRFCASPAEADGVRQLLTAKVKRS